MIRGSGAPQAELWEGDTKIDATIALPRPQRREVQDYEAVTVSLGANAFGEPVTKVLGYRYRVVMVWLLTDGNRAELMTTVGRLISWTGENQRIKFRPHADTSIWERVTVVNNPEKPYDGLATADEIKLELLGLNLRPQKPNLWLDRRGRPNVSVP